MVVQQRTKIFSTHQVCSLCLDHSHPLSDDRHEAPARIQEDQEDLSTIFEDHEGNNLDSDEDDLPPGASILPTHLTTASLERRHQPAVRSFTDAAEIAILSSSASFSPAKVSPPTRAPPVTQAVPLPRLAFPSIPPASKTSELPAAAGRKVMKKSGKEPVVAATPDSNQGASDSQSSSSQRHQQRDATSKPAANPVVPEKGKGRAKKQALAVVSIDEPLQAGAVAIAPKAHPKPRATGGKGNPDSQGPVTCACRSGTAGTR
jgi:hypothetical protein